MSKKIKLDSNGYQNNLIGNSGQYLAMYHLSMNNILSHLTEPGSPCDIISEYKDHIIRFQVKTMYRMNENPFYRFSFLLKSRRTCSLREHLDKANGYILVVLNQKIVSFVDSGSITSINKRYRSKVIDYAPYIKKNGNRYNQTYLEDLTLDKFLYEWEQKQNAS